MGDSKSDWDFTPTNDCWTSFASAHFAEGVSRRAYRAMRWKPLHKCGERAVVKEYKQAFAWAKGDWDTAVRTYAKARLLAEQYNRNSGVCPIEIVDCDVQQVSSQSDNRTPKLGEWVMVEDYLNGDFQKFISNSGWVKPRCTSENPSMPAFAHWSWAQTDGELMVSDLQGVHSPGKYILTDPAILSLSAEYGVTDLALVGMGLFFLSHQCTDVCRLLLVDQKRPDMSIVEHMVNMQFGSFVQSATTYFPDGFYQSLPAQTKLALRAALIKTFL